MATSTSVIKFALTLALIGLVAATTTPASTTGLFTTAPPEQEDAAATPHAPRQLCSKGGGEAAADWLCTNWAGTISWAPSSVFVPADETELIDYLRAAAAAAAAAPPAAPRPSLKVVGFAHSWAGLFLPAAGADGRRGETVALHRLSGITAVSADRRSVEVLAGTSFAQLFKELDALGLGLAWPPGGIQGLTVGGAVSVGFHGSQASLGGVSSVVRALRLVDTEGGIHDLSDADSPEQMRAARMGLGMCGILTRVTLPVVPQFHLQRRRWRVDDGEGFLTYQLPGLKAKYDRFHYYMHPATGSAWPMYWAPATAAESAAEARPCRTAAEQSEDAEMKEFGVDGLPLIMRWDNCSDVSYRSLTHAVDMELQPLWNGEYYVPVDDATEAAAVQAILSSFDAVAASRGGRGAGPNPDVWLHVRYVAGDMDSLMNPCYGSQVCAAIELALVAPSMHALLPPWAEWEAYFKAMEDVLLPLGGRPHHAKFQTGKLPATPGYGLPVREFRERCAVYDKAGLLKSESFERLFGAVTSGASGADGDDSAASVAEE